MRPGQRLASVVSPAPRSTWLDVLGTSPQRIAFQRPSWLDCVCEVGGYEDVSRLYVTAEGRSLVLPLVARHGFVHALRIAASLPAQWGFAGIIAPDGVRPEDVALVLEDLRAHTALRTSLKPGPLAAAAWEAAAPVGVPRVRHTVHVLDLEGGFDVVWRKRFSSNTRNKMRKAQRSSVTITQDPPSRAIAIFYQLYLRSIERWASKEREPAAIARLRWRWQRREPLEKFRAVARGLGGDLRTWLAWVDGRPAAAILVIVDGPNAVYWRAAMDVALAGPARANYLLQLRAIEDACAAGCRYYHMGESSPSIAEFKSAFGARPWRYDEYRLEALPLTSVVERVDAARGQLRDRFLADRSATRVPR